MINRRLVFAVFAIIAIISAWFFRSIISYIVIAAVISLIGQPIADFFSGWHFRRYKAPDWFGALATLSIFYALFIGFISLVIPRVMSEARLLSDIDPAEAMRNLLLPMKKIENFINLYKLAGAQPIVLEEKLADFLVNAFNLARFSNIVNEFVMMTGNFLVALFSITFMSFFFMKEKNLLNNAIFLMVPSKHENALNNIIRDSKALLRRYFVGVLIEVTIVVAMVSLGLTIVGVENALLIGFTAGILNIIPYVGPLAGTFIGIVIAATTHLQFDLITELLPFLLKVFSVFFVTQLTDNIILQPIIYGNSVHAHPLEIFLVILIAGTIAGVAGMILAIPTYTILRVIAREFLANFRIIQRLTRDM